MKKVVYMLVVELNGKEVVKVFSGLALVNEFMGKNKGAVAKHCYRMPLNA